MKTDREKLINWIKNTYVFYSRYAYKAVVDDTAAATIADCLITNGVIVREKGEWEEGEWTGEVRCYYRNSDYGDRSHLCQHTPLNCSTCHMNEAKNKRTKKCSVCGKRQMRKTNFCPNCGADMKEKNQ